MSMKWEIAKSIYNKIISKCPIGYFRSKLKHQPSSAYALRLCPARNTVQAPSGVEKGKSESAAFIILSKDYNIAKRQTLAASVVFLDFNTETERYNAWQSYLTKFARFCVMLDESTKLAPYMDDYTEPWTDERFKQYFGLTDIEWQLIDTVIKD